MGAINARAGEGLALILSFTALALGTLILRLYTRIFLIKRPSYEDYLMLIAMIFSIGYAVAFSYGVKNGLGEHIWTLGFSTIPKYLQTLYSVIIVYNASLAFIKISILLQYSRLVTKPGLVQKALWVLIIVNIAYGIASVFSIVFQCTPVAYFWDYRIPGGKCINVVTASLANAGINVVLDFSILFFPILIMKDSIMPSTQKWIVIGILSFGGFACIASILRLYFLRRNFVSSIQDPTWHGTTIGVWSAIEMNSAIICGSVSTLRPLLARMFPHVFSFQNRPPNDFDFETSQSRNDSASSKPGQSNSLHDISENATLKDGEMLA